MRKKKFAIIVFFAFSAAIVFFEGCSGRIKYLLGERIEELSVKNTQGTYTSLFLKSNGDVLTISEDSSMRYIALQDNCAICYEPIFLYKNTIDTLYFVWWGRSSAPPQIKTNANIQFIFEPYYNPETVKKYITLGFVKFPSDVY